MSRELCLVHPLPMPSMRGGPISVIKESETRSWERTAQGDFVIRLAELPDQEFVVPAAGVKYERRARVSKPEPKK